MTSDTFLLASAIAKSRTTALRGALPQRSGTSTTASERRGSRSKVITASLCVARPSYHAGLLSEPERQNIAVDGSGFGPGSMIAFDALS